MTTLKAPRIEALKGKLTGTVILPEDDLYESARKVWNATIDKHPALIVRCATTSDVVCAVNFAKDNGLALAVRGGGHNIAGSAMCDDGVVVDLSLMKAARINAGRGAALIDINFGCPVKKVVNRLAGSALMRE